jgi:Helix-turn-helix domain
VAYPALHGRGETANLGRAPGRGPGQTHRPDDGTTDVSLRVLISKSGGIGPRARITNERHLSLAEREEISRGLAAGLSLRSLSPRASLGRPRRSAER